MRARFSTIDTQASTAFSSRPPIDPPRGGTCCITLANICDLDEHQIFTTHDGKNYDRLALKKWLMGSSRMPHNNVPSSQDSLALYHRGIATRNRALVENCCMAVILIGAALVCIGAQYKLTAYIVSRLGTMPPNLQTARAQDQSTALLTGSMAFFAGLGVLVWARAMDREVSLLMAGPYGKSL